MLLLAQKGVYSTKIFEYLAVAKPIFALIPNGIAARLVLDARVGIVVNPLDVQQIKNGFSSLFDNWEKGALSVSPNWEIIRQYDRKILAESLANCFSAVMSQANDGFRK